MRPVAPQLAELVENLLGAPLPIRLRAWDGSEAGPAGPDVPVAVLRHRRALRRLLWNPGELGLARAFVAGELEVEGNVEDGLSRFWNLAATTGTPTIGLADKLAAARLALRLGVIGPRPKPPASEARLSGGLHTRRRDRAAIAHHYDLSNDFYEFLLDPNMAYSCGYWTDEQSPGYALEDAQRDKLDTICRKLGLRPGMRLLDVGCGWASLLVHAAQHYGVHAVGVTLSEQQRRYGTERVAAAGLADRVEIRLQDYRAVGGATSPDQPFDAVSSIEMGEHVGEHNYPTYAAQLQKLVLPHGRVLLQQMTRGAAGANSAPGGGAFMERYVAPDMFMRPLGSTLNFLEAAGLEVVDVHSLREHYVWTVQPWLDTLREREAEAVALIGEEQFRVWVLYLAGAALAFRENRMGVHQILLVRPGPGGTSGLPRARTEILGRDPGLPETAPAPTPVPNGRTVAGK